MVSLLIGWSSAQAQGQSPVSPFLSVRPDITVLIREHNTGAEILEVTAVDATYPDAQLREQVLKLGQELGVEPRGLQINATEMRSGDASTRILKARFAVVGLVDRSAGVLRLQPLLRAFAGGTPPHEVRGLSIIFDGERPTTKTVRTFRSPTVIAEARATEAVAGGLPASIEYRVGLLSQNPAELSFPESAQEQAPVQVPSKEKVVQGPSPIIWLAVLVGGLAVGALVYSAMLRGGQPARR